MKVVLNSFSYAHPPNNVKLSYLHEEETLTIEMVHVTSDRTKDYIRKIDILRTEGDSKELYYVRQNKSKNVKKDIFIKLNENEKIIVKIYSKEGGVFENSFIVPEIEKETDIKI